MMVMMMTAARTTLVLLSLLGYVHAVSKRLRPEFSIGVSLTAIGSAMFLAGILGVLPYAAWAICLAGAALLAWALYKRESFRGLLCAGVFFFLGYGVVLAAAIHGCKFAHPDDFNHWAIAVQRLLVHDRFPDATETYFNFQSYPLGSASFIYYFTYLTGLRAEWIQVFIQDMLIAGVLAGLFVFVRRWYTAALAAVICVLATAADTSSDHELLYSLLVDILLPAVALGAVALCLYYRDELAEKLWWTAPYTVFLMSVKNSGVFFVAVVLLLALALMKKRRRTVARWAGCALCPATALLAWQQHVRIAFPDTGLTARHSMSLESFREVFGGKTAADIRSITGTYFQRVFSLSNPFLYLLAGLILLYLARRFILGDKDCGDLRRVTALAVLSYVGYIAGMYGMYMFSMPLTEAVYIAGYDRYEMTFTVFLAGLLFIGAAPIVELAAQAQTSRRRWLAGALCAAMTALTFLPLHPNPQYLHGQGTPSTDRQKLEEILAPYHFDRQLTYLFLFPTEDGWIDMDSVNYLLQPRFFAYQSVDFMNGKDFLLEQYDYIVVVDESDETRSYMLSHFGEADLRVAAISK